MWWQPSISKYHSGRNVCSVPWILSVGHDQYDALKEYWFRDPMCHVLFYSHVMQHNRIFKILRFLHSENNNEVTVKFKAKLVFHEYITKKRKRMTLKLCQVNDSLEYTYDKRVYLGEQGENATDYVTAKRGTVLNVEWRVENKTHTIYMNSYFSSPQLNLRSPQQKYLFLFFSPPQQKAYSCKF